MSIGQDIRQLAKLLSTASDVAERINRELTGEPVERLVAPKVIRRKSYNRAPEAFKVAVGSMQVGQTNTITNAEFPGDLYAWMWTYSKKNNKKFSTNKIHGGYMLKRLA